MYLIFAATLLAGLAEGVGILMLLPLLNTLGSGNTSSQLEGISKYINEMLVLLGLQDSTITVLLIITFTFIAKGLMTFAALGFNAYLAGQLTKSLKSGLFNAYSKMNYSYYSSKDTGHFVNLINEQINRGMQSFQHFTQFGTQCINAFVYLTLAFIVAWRFGLMALIAGISMLLLFRRLSGYVRVLSRNTAQESGILSKLLIQAITSYKYLTDTNRMPSVDYAISKSISQLTTYQIKAGISVAITKSVREPLAMVFISAILLFQLVVLNQSLAPILVSILLFYRGFNSVITIQNSWLNMLEKIGSMEKVHEEFKNQSKNSEQSGDKYLTSLRSSIRVCDLSFRYSSDLPYALSNVSFEIPAYKSVALVGESGSGKSTLVDLLTLLLRPQLGDVYIDDISSKHINLSSWRRLIGFVSQETVMFDDTIANNICLWSGNPEEDQDLYLRIREAAKKAHISSFVESLPDGYNTRIGDRGLRLSGGQCQRLFIARELFKCPKFLILDEATSALDSESELAIQRSIDELKGKTTVIIIAHRLSTIRNVDTIHVFSRGRLVESGDYDSLMRDQTSAFFKLANLQYL